MDVNGQPVMHLITWQHDGKRSIKLPHRLPPHALIDTHGTSPKTENPKIRKSV